jgi:hypothetical protein
MKLRDNHDPQICYRSFMKGFAVIGTIFKCSMDMKGHGEQHHLLKFNLAKSIKFDKI